MLLPNRTCLNRCDETRYRYTYNFNYKGDLKSITISAASVIAKVTRDRVLEELDKKYPMYDFKDNKGYPTKKHLEAIKKYGIIDEHRRSYGPVSEYLELTKQ